MSQSKAASPGLIAVVVVVGLLILGGLYWKFMGPGSQPRAPGGYGRAPYPGAMLPSGSPGAPGPGGTR